jgi:DtxR family Mn-dependent transcriptional regulator
MPEQESIPLADVKSEGSYVIASVSDKDVQTLRQLKASGITPGATLRVKRHDAVEGYSVSIGHSAVAVEIAPAVAQDIRILPTIE